MMIGELAASLGVSTKTLRLYEERGLIPAPSRAGNGYRAYGEEAVRRAGLVVGLRAIGLSLETIAGLLSHRKAQEINLRRALAGLLSEQIQNLSLEIAVKQGRMDDLDARYLALLDTPKDAPADCVCRALNRQCRCETRVVASAPAARSNGARPAAPSKPARTRRRV